MSTLDELKQALDRLLSLTVATRLLQLNSNSSERAYEAYVLALCMHAVRKQGGTAELVGIKSGLNPPNRSFSRRSWLYGIRYSRFLLCSMLSS